MYVQRGQSSPNSCLVEPNLRHLAPRNGRRCSLVIQSRVRGKESAQEIGFLFYRVDQDVISCAKQRKRRLAEVYILNYFNFNNNEIHLKCTYKTINISTINTAEQYLFLLISTLCTVQFRFTQKSKYSQYVHRCFDICFL